MAVRNHLIWLQELQLVGAVSRSLPDFAILDWLWTDSYIDAKTRQQLSSDMKAYKSEVRQAVLEAKFRNFNNLVGQKNPHK